MHRLYYFTIREIMLGEKVDISNKLILAPMADVTDTPFRTIAREHGAALSFTQMISAKGVIDNNFETLRYLAFSKNEKPIGVQLLGNDPAIIGEAVSEIRKYSPDWIDINCGCPVGKVTKYNMGACLMNEPINLAKIIIQLKDNAGEIPVSVKIRLGPDNSHINVIENAKLAEDNGADAVIVHARTTADNYMVDPNWDWIRKVKESVNIKVIGNGSVFNALDAHNMLNETGCDAVLVARGALGNPFIFQNFNENKFEENHSYPENLNDVLNVTLKHIDMIYKEYGPVNSLNKIKKNIFWYLRFYPGIEQLIQNVLPMQDFELIYNYVKEHTFKVAENYYPQINYEEINQKFINRVAFWIVNQKPNYYQYVH